MHKAIIHNMMLLLHSGAFNIACTDQLQAMSPHKWRMLVEAANAMGILPHIAHGAEMLRGQKYASQVLFNALQEKNETIYTQHYDTSNAHLFNHWTEKRLNEVREEEMNAQDTSEETLTLLDIIVKNAADIITNDVSVAGIVALGCNVRMHGDTINYEKLSSWLSYIGLVQLASLEGNMLIACFNFKEEELPFVVKPYKSAGKIFMHSLQNTFRKHSCNKATRLNVAMLETMSYNFMTAISKVTDIEE